MIDKPRRDIKVITSELQAALKRDAANIIDIGNLLLEAQEQLGHGEWLPWLKLNFGSSTRTAQNYMNAARFALKYATVAYLKLRPTALYLLGSGTVALDEIDAILKVAETEWVDFERAVEISNLFQEERLRDTDEEPDRAEKRKAEEAARSEIDDILDGPPPELPETGVEPIAVDLTLKAFDEAVAALFRLHTKPLSSFSGTTHSLRELTTIAEFIVEVAKQTEIA